MKILKKLCYLILSLSMVSCASYERIRVPPPDNAIQEQVRVLSSWHKGMEFEKANQAINWRIWKYYGILENGKKLKFINVTNPETRGAFGLFISDNRLLSLLSGDNAEFLWDCLLPFNQHGQHWAVGGLEQYLPWVKSNSILGNKKMLAVGGVFREYSDKSTSMEIRRTIDDVLGKTVAVIVYAPFFLVALPVMAFQRDAYTAKRLDLARVRGFQDAITLGTTAPSLDNYPPDRIFKLDRMTVYQYDIDRFAFGVKNDKVVMVESPAAMKIYNQQRYRSEKIHSRNNCQALTHSLK